MPYLPSTPAMLDRVRPFAYSPTPHKHQQTSQQDTQRCIRVAWHAV